MPAYVIVVPGFGRDGEVSVQQTMAAKPHAGVCCVRKAHC